MKVLIGEEDCTSRACIETRFKKNVFLIHVLQTKAVRPSIKTLFKSISNG